MLASVSTGSCSMAADEELAAIYAREEAAVVADLRQVGVAVDRLPQLLNARLPASAAGPLLTHLRGARTHAARELLIRAVSDRTFAGKIAPDLAALFESSEYAAHRWTIGQALSVVATPDEAPLLVDLARRSEFGRDREMIVVGLGKVKSGAADRVLLELLDDDSVAGHAVKALSLQPSARLRVLDVAPVRRFVDDQRGWVRRAASVVLKKSGIAD